MRGSSLRSTVHFIKGKNTNRMDLPNACGHVLRHDPHILMHAQGSLESVAGGHDRAYRSAVEPV